MFFNPYVQDVRCGATTRCLLRCAEMHMEHNCGVGSLQKWLPNFCHTFVLTLLWVVASRCFRVLMTNFSHPLCWDCRLQESSRVLFSQPWGRGEQWSTSDESIEIVGQDLTFQPPALWSQFQICSVLDQCQYKSSKVSPKTNGPTNQ